MHGANMGQTSVQMAVAGVQGEMGPADRAEKT